MSDSVKKWYEMQEEENNEVERVTSSSILSEGMKKEAYSILVNHHEEAILEAARILTKNGK
jgi:hypothetical protein